MSFSNQLKTAALLGLLTVILLIIGGFIGGETGLMVGFVFALIINFFSYWFSDKIVLMLYRAHEAKKGEHPRLFKIVERVRERFGLPMPRVYIIHNPSPNAFATGRNAKHAAVAVTTGILHLLDDEELEGVIAHEFSHIKNNDILVASIAAVIAGTIAYLAMIVRYSALFRRDGEKGPGLLELIVIGIITPIIAVIVQLAISRSREFLADETAARTLREHKGLANALAKLETGIAAKPMVEANTGTAHLFIANPFSAKGVIGFFSTHPAMGDRIAKLEKLRY